MRLFQAPIWCPSGGGGKQEAAVAVAESLVGSGSTRKHTTVARAIGPVSTRFGEDEEQLDRRLIVNLGTGEVCTLSTRDRNNSQESEPEATVIKRGRKEKYNEGKK